MNTRRIRAALDIERDNIPDVLTRAQSMAIGLNADKVTYSAPNPTLPVFLGLIQNLVVAQQVVPAGTKGAAATRDVQRDLLVTGMESERMYIQVLADASPLKAIMLIENAGLVVANSPARTKAFLVLSPGKPPGTVVCDANVGLLLGAGRKPGRARFFTWEYTVDGGKTFVSASPTPTGKTTLEGLTPLTMVGVRVNLHDVDGPGAWSQVATILVR